MITFNSLYKLLNEMLTKLLAQFFIYKEKHADVSNMFF